MVFFEDRVRTFDQQQLLRSLGNLTKKLSVEKDPKSISTLQKRISAIQEEIRNRYDSRELAGSSGQGVLSLMGYRVGDVAGMRTEFRRHILTYIAEGPIPWVGDSYYMKEWGREGSMARISKLKRCLIGFLSNKAHQRKSRAVKEWSSDLEWLNHQYP